MRLVIVAALFLAGCSSNPKPCHVVEVRPDGCYKMDECNWCCPVDAGGTAFSCTLLGCVKELP